MLNNILRIKAPSGSETNRFAAPEACDFGLLTQQLFTRMLWLERKRTERSSRRFVLMLLEPGRLLKAAGSEKTLSQILLSLSQTIRDTDITGWYKEGATIGVIFTEVGTIGDESLVATLSAKVSESLYRNLTVEQVNEIRLSFHVFPEDWDDERSGAPVTSTLSLNLAQGFRQRTVSTHLKRSMDIAGSLAALLLCLPVLVAIAIAIKMTSKGPVLFRQVRLGQYGKRFTFLKFRSMYHRNDPSIHEQYVKQYIAGATGTESASGGAPKLFKLTADPRITPLGRFLRRTSLDELPQFLNVLAGHMSLVGPRPPVTYEYDRYDLWHKQRLLAVKPGITGLWQVDGRSRVKFDDMVRLDIRYARTWSLWLDVKILLKTPGAMVSGNGAC